MHHFDGGGGGTRKHREAGRGRPEDGGVWTAKTAKRPPQQPAHPQYANYWAPLTRKWHILPHPAQPQHTNHWAPRTRKRHQQEHRPQQLTESSDLTQHAKGRTGDRPGPRKETATRRTVTQGDANAFICIAFFALSTCTPPPPLPAWWMRPACVWRGSSMARFRRSICWAPICLQPSGGRPLYAFCLFIPTPRRG